MPSAVAAAVAAVPAVTTAVALWVTLALAAVSELAELVLYLTVNDVPRDRSRDGAAPPELASSEL